MKPMEFEKDDVIIKYGDIGMTYYILTEGQVKVTIYEPGTNPEDPEIHTKEKFTKQMDKGTCFGELALLYNDKRSATITALERCKTYILEGTLFKQILIKSSMSQRQLKLGFLESIKLFGNLDKFQKLKLADGLTEVNLEKGEVVIKEGDQGKEFYIIEEG